jgi:molybdenum-dependent DNA-binding transcriptional regulator ModE
VDELNKLLSEPVVTTATGGAKGGGTTVTPVGEKTIALYHSIEARTELPRATNFSLSKIDARLSAPRKDDFPPAVGVIGNTYRLVALSAHTG